MQHGKTRYYRRQSLRLATHDYQNHDGSYFVTLRAKNRAKLFSHIDIRGNLYLSFYGKLVSQEWLSLPDRFPQVSLDAFVVMPEHFHGLLHITNYPDITSIHLGRIIGAFKSLSNHAINRTLFDGYIHVWQNDYYESIIRDAMHLENVRAYIQKNPERYAQKYPLRCTE